MIKLNRTTEYSLMALSYMRGKGGLLAGSNLELPPTSVSSTREIADKFHLPFEILAKTLQKLKEQGIIASTYGTRGGYVIARDLKTLDFSEFLKLMEGPVSVVSCAHADPKIETKSCEYSSACSIKPVMADLNKRIYDFLSRISLEELTRSPLITPIFEKNDQAVTQNFAAALSSIGEEP